MVSCVIVLLVLSAGYVLYHKKKILKNLSLKEVRIILLILLGTDFLAGVLFMTGGKGSLDSLSFQRNKYGEGTRTEKLQVSVPGKLKNENIDINISEQKYTNKEIKVIFKKCEKRLDQIILNKNSSPDHVDQDLNLVTTMPGYPIEITWSLDNYEVLDPYGHIQDSHTKKSGTVVTLTATLAYEKQQSVYTIAVKVFPRKLSKRETILRAIRKSVRESDWATAHRDTYVLPTSVGRQAVAWSRGQDKRGYYLLGLGILGACLFPFVKKQKELQRKKDRQKKLQMDFPNIVSECSMLLQAGMNMKQAWMKIADNYLKRKQNAEGDFAIRPAYEEMIVGCREMQGGISEAEVYEHYGKRCERTEYTKFAILLSQNVRRGTKGIAQQLETEGMRAFEQRKALAKRQGEEAGTKLLVPMFLMLAIVLIIVIVPAFMSVNI